MKWEKKIVRCGEWKRTVTYAFQTKSSTVAPGVDMLVLSHIENGCYAKLTSNVFMISVGSKFDRLDNREAKSTIILR
jgi:hypothetical protein